jgi:diacylglycerol kinase (ATP)
MPDQKRPCFIFNPSANGGRAARKEKTLKSAVMKHWPDAEWMVTRADNSTWPKLREEIGHFNLLVACGGDGTVHKAGNLAADAGCTLGVIPLGSGNDFAKMNNIPESAGSALEKLKANKATEVDLIHCSGDISCWCLNTFGFGLDGLANYYTNFYKQYIGKSGYLPGALRAAMVSKPVEFKLKIDDAGEKAESLIMLTACNGFREGGRFIVAPDAVINDGKLNLLMVKPMNKLRLLITLPQFINRFPRNHKKIRSAECAKLELKSDEPVYIHVDGEFSGRQVRHIKLEAKKQILKLIS